MFTMEDNETEVYDLMFADHQLKVSEITETVGISKDREIVAAFAHSRRELVSVSLCNRRQSMDPMVLI